MSKKADFVSKKEYYIHNDLLNLLHLFNFQKELKYKPITFENALNLCNKILDSDVHPNDENTLIHQIIRWYGIENDGLENVMKNSTFKSEFTLLNVLEFLKSEYNLMIRFNNDFTSISYYEITSEKLDLVYEMKDLGKGGVIDDILNCIKHIINSNLKKEFTINDLNESFEKGYKTAKLHMLNQISNL